MTDQQPTEPTAPVPLADLQRLARLTGELHTLAVTLLAAACGPVPGTSYSPAEYAARYFEQARPELPGGPLAEE